MAIAYDSIGAGDTETGGDAVLSWTHTVGSGSDRAMFIAIGHADAANDRAREVLVDGVPAGRVCMVQNNAGSAFSTEIFCLVNPPASTTVTITATINDGTWNDAAANSVVYTGVNQSRPYRAVLGNYNTGGTAPSVTLQDLASGEVAVAGVFHDSTDVLTEDGTVTERFLVDPVSNDGGLAWWEKSGTGDVTVNGTISGTEEYSICGCILVSADSDEIALAMQDVIRGDAVTSVSKSVNVVAGNNRCLVVAATEADGAGTGDDFITSITLEDGSPTSFFTQVVRATRTIGGEDNCYAEVWELRAPATGTHTLTVNFSDNANDICVHILQFNEVDQTTAFKDTRSATGNSATLSDTIPILQDREVGLAVATSDSSEAHIPGFTNGGDADHDIVCYADYRGPNATPDQTSTVHAVWGPANDVDLTLDRMTIGNADPWAIVFAKLVPANPSGIYLVGQPSETDSALGITPSGGAATQAIGIASETDSALTITPQAGQIVVLSIVSETDSVPGIVKPQRGDGAEIWLVGTATNNTDNAASMSLSLPNGVLDDDLILFFGSCDGIAGYSAPSGFTNLQDVNTAGTHNNRLDYRRASSEPASYTINVALGSERGWGIFAVYRNVNWDDPIDASNSNAGGSNTTGVISAITPASDGHAVAVFVGTESGNAGNPIATSWPGSLVEQNDNVNGPPGTGNGSSGGAFADVIQTSAGEVSGNISLTGGSTNWGVMAVSLEPRIRPMPLAIVTESNAALEMTPSGSATEQSRTASPDALASVPRSRTSSLDGLAQGRQSATASTDAQLLASLLRTANLNAAVESEKSASASLESLIAAALSATSVLEAVVRAERSATVSVDGAAQSARQASLGIDAIINAAVSGERSATASLDGMARKAQTLSASLNAMVERSFMMTANADGVLMAARDIAGDLDAAIEQERTRDVGADAILKRAMAAAVTLHAIIRQADSVTAALDASIVLARTLSGTLDAVVRRLGAAAVNLDALVRGQASQLLGFDALLVDPAFEAPSSRTASPRGARTFSSGNPDRRFGTQGGAGKRTGGSAGTGRTVTLPPGDRKRLN